MSPLVKVELVGHNIDGAFGRALVERLGDRDSQVSVESLQLGRLSLQLPMAAAETYFR